MRVLVTEPVHADALTLLCDAGWEVVQASGALTAADALLVRVRKLSPSEVAGFSLIAKHGVGVDNIPLEAARTAGVAVMNTPGANAGAVAEQAMLFILALTRDLDGQRRGPVAVAGAEGRRLLVLGYGASGARVADLARGFGMFVTVFTRRPEVASRYDVVTDLDAALANADVVSLHLPLTDTTRNLLCARRLALLPRGALVVNCARGGLIDETALEAGLRSGALGGAALDVTEVEPLPAGATLRGAPNLILTPHLAAQSTGAFRAMGMMAAQNILDHFAGRADPARIVVQGG